MNADYTLNASGGFLFYPNVSAGGSNFSVWNGATRHRIPMADPTILKLGNWYYVTGTSDAAKAANFCVYKSPDLVNWYPHMTAFSETARGGTYDWTLSGPFTSTPPGGTSITIHSRMFRNLWAPQLYRDGGLIWLSFTACEGPDAPALCGGAATTPPSTVQCATISVADFVVGGQSKQFAMNAWEPMTYYYQVNDTGGGALDGGFAQGHSIPVTGDFALYDPCTPPLNGEVRRSGDIFNTSTYGHQGQPRNNTWMALDSFVYWDPIASRRWMLYTWYEGSDTNYKGNNVAAYPMLDNRRMHAMAPASDLIPIAYRFHTWYWPSHNLECAMGTPATAYWNVPGCGNEVWMLNGVSGKTGYRLGGCGANANQAVAEGPAAFSNGTRTYVMYSRNAWDSPAYGIFYRTAVGDFRSLSQSGWTDSTTPEHELVRSIDRGRPGGRNYGHGEMFVGPGGKEYLVFHAKEQATTGAPPACPTGPIAIGAFPSGYSGRTIHFKELTINGSGLITPLSNDATASVSDADCFLIPVP